LYESMAIDSYKRLYAMINDKIFYEQ
jgi:hypothetical protein